MARSKQSASRGRGRQNASLRGAISRLSPRDLVMLARAGRAIVGATAPLARRAAGAVISSTSGYGRRLMQYRGPRPGIRKHYGGGRYKSKRAAKPRKVTRLPKYNMKGAVFKREDGNVVSDSDCTYVGHSNAPNKGVNFVVWMALLRALMEKAGIKVKSFEETTSALNVDNYVFKVFWFQTTSATTTSSYTLTIGAPPNLTFKSTCERIAQDFAVGTVGPDSMFKDVILEDPSGDTVARMSFSSINVYLRLKSLLCIQNRTIAKSGVADESNINDVAQNPLYGYLYKAKGTGFQPKQRFAGETSYEGFMADKDSGIIEAVALNSLKDIQKPPHPGYFQRCSRHRRDILNPGVIKRDYLEDNYKMSWNTYWRRMNLGGGPDALDGTVKRTFLGTAHMYCHEKMLNSRSEEPDIAVGYEINLELSALISEKKGSFVPALVEIIA